jgi:hypothetical protein
MVPSFPHDMRDLSMPGCHHPRKEHFEKMTMMSTAAPSMGMRSPQTTRVSVMASDSKHQRGLTPLMLRSMTATPPGLSCYRMSRSKAPSPVSLPEDGPSVASITHAVAKDSMATALAIGNPTPGFWQSNCGDSAWFSGVSGMVIVKPSTSLACRSFHNQPLSAGCSVSSATSTNQSCNAPSGSFARARQSFPVSADGGSRFSHRQSLATRVTAA